MYLNMIFKFGSQLTKAFKLTSFLCFIITTSSSTAQELTDRDKGVVFVDEQGVMRWGGNKQEVKGFGVNYSVPFAHAYRQAINMGIDPKEAIDKDIYHFTRLDFDLYRLHVWDTEISDTLGNLIENEHLDTFDYLLKKLKDNNINYVITPIAFWGNGWPEPDTDTPGFSGKYGKNNSLDTLPAIRAAQNYLEQFLNHVNPYTGVAYKDEPNIIAFEVSNEPHHRGEAAEITTYVKGMVDAMRRSGTQKPIFYNGSHGVHFTQAYFEGGIQGGTFQWYPTGLGYGWEIPGNLLPNVSDYNIPFDEVYKANKGAKLVYEFDAADVGRSYIYPAMARSFREAGIQIATHFAYDPTYLAPVNTEYDTHYMNLAYTPQKALSLMIAGKVFHEIPMYTDHGRYPENFNFGNTTVSYEKNLAVYNTPETFIYTNNTTTSPKNTKKLTKIAGFANSPIVKYDGTGAYFLDKLGAETWRLEVMPDAVWVDDPFGQNSPDKIVGVVKSAIHRMQINLPELAEGFIVEAINEGNSFNPELTGNSFSVRPGTYSISKKETKKKWLANQAFGSYQLNNFFAPETTVKKPWLRHNPVTEASAGKAIILEVQFIAPWEPEQIQLMAQIGFSRELLEMKKTGAYTYSATIPAEKVKAGFLTYHILVNKKADEYLTYPAGLEGKPYDWDFYDREPYEVRIVPSANPIYLFDAKTDSDKLVRRWGRGFELQPTENWNEAEYRMPVEKLFVTDQENLNAKPVYDYTFKHFVLDAVEGRREDLSSKTKLVVKGRSLYNKPLHLQVAFVLDDGTAHGAMLTLDPKINSYVMDLKELKPVQTVTLPRPYPSFLPYYLEHTIERSFDINRVESLQFSIGPGLSEKEQQESHGIALIRVSLE